MIRINANITTKMNGSSNRWRRYALCRRGACSLGVTILLILRAFPFVCSLLYFWQVMVVLGLGALPTILITTKMDISVVKNGATGTYFEVKSLSSKSRIFTYRNTPRTIASVVGRNMVLRKTAVIKDSSNGRHQ